MQFFYHALLYSHQVRLVKRLWVFLLISPLSIAAFSQELPEQYREKFSESFPIRKQQHLEMKAYVDRILGEKINESMDGFRPDFFSIADYAASLYPYRQKLGSYLGYPPPKAIQGKMTKFEKAGEDKHSIIYRAWIEVIEGVQAYGIYMVPKNLKGKAPLIIAQHGGGGNPEAICGLDTRINYYNFGHEAVKRGYIVWAPGLTMLSGYAADPEIPGISRESLDKQLRIAGTSIIGVEIHKIIESTKVLIRERSEIDVDNIGMTGLSWGGFFTMYTTALCPFIKAAVPSAYFRDTQVELERLAGAESKSSQNYSFEGLGHFQAIGMICPRPCMVQIGKNDQLFDLNGAKEEAKRASIYYEKLGIPENFQFNVHPDGHVFENESIFAFFEKHLMTSRTNKKQK